jgi:hypothetical protein
VRGAGLRSQETSDTVAANSREDNPMTTQEIAKQYVALCQSGKFRECLHSLFAKRWI